jgi:hypothetical protein
LTNHELREKFLLKILEEYRNYVKIKISKISLSVLPHETIAMVNIYCKHWNERSYIKKLDVISWGNIVKMNFEILMIFLLNLNI